jgi:hypothetical protein
LWYVLLAFYYTLPLILLWSATVLLQPTFLPGLVHQKVIDAKDVLTARHGHWTKFAFIWPELHAATALLCFFIISDSSRLPTVVLVMGWVYLLCFCPLSWWYLCCTGHKNTSPQQQEMMEVKNEALERV